MDAWSEVQLEMTRGRREAQLREASVERLVRSDKVLAPGTPVRQATVISPRLRPSAPQLIGR
ncbi:MAG: hypothetical protein ABI573_11250 [Chloroflexota bacterium]